MHLRKGRTINHNYPICSVHLRELPSISLDRISRKNRRVSRGKWLYEPGNSGKCESIVAFFFSFIFLFFPIDHNYHVPHKNVFSFPCTNVWPRKKGCPFFMRGLVWYDRHPSSIQRTRHPYSVLVTRTAYSSPVQRTAYSSPVQRTAYSVLVTRTAYSSPV